MLKILLECTKNMFASKGIWTGESERLKTRPRGESTEKGRGKAEIQNELLPLSKKHSQGKQSACFSAEEEKRLQEVGVRRGRRRSSENREEQRTVRASLRTEKRRQRALNALCASGHHKEIPPLRRRSFCTASLQKLKKAKGALLFLRLVLRSCCWLSMMLSKLGSAFPKDPSEQKSGS